LPNGAIYYVHHVDHGSFFYLLIFKLLLLLEELRSPFPRLLLPFAFLLGLDKNDADLPPHSRHLLGPPPQYSFQPLRVVLPHRNVPCFELRLQTLPVLADLDAIRSEGELL
jgi:hypothetical protein